jgi:hypothetical protein
MTARVVKYRFLSDLTVSVSVVVLVYINLIRNFLFASARDSYYLHIGFYDRIIALTLILSLSLLCFLGIQSLRKINNSILNVLAGLLFFLALLNPIHFIVLSLLGTSYHPEGLVYIWIMMPNRTKMILVVVAIVVLVLFVRFYWQIFRLARLFAVVTFPFAVLAILQLVWHVVSGLAAEHHQWPNGHKPIISSATHADQVGNTPIGANLSI